MSNILPIPTVRELKDVDGSVYCRETTIATVPAYNTDSGAPGEVRVCVLDDEGPVRVSLEKVGVEFTPAQTVALVEAVVDATQLAARLEKARADQFNTKAQALMGLMDTHGANTIGELIEARRSQVEGEDK